jgi:hypothetical protein
MSHGPRPSVKVEVALAVSEAVEFTEVRTGVRQLVMILGSIGGGIALVCEIPLAFRLWRATRRAPDLPLSMRLNPFNILASRDRWTPEIEALNRSMVTAGLVWLGFVVLVAVAGLMG